MSCSRQLAGCLLFVLGWTVQGWTQQQPAGRDPAGLMMQTDAVAPERFVAAHGEQALLMGYSRLGLEAWAYPFQLFRNYQVEFLPAGSSAAVEGNAILRRIEVRPEEVVRIYVGPDFEVREHLFVPHDQPGVIVTYDVSGHRAVDVKVTFLPVLNLMWPGGLGGQDLGWRADLSGYSISELTTGMRAVIASPQQTAHTEVVNSTLRTDLTQSMVLQPQQGQARLYAALENGREAPGTELHRLEGQTQEWMEAAQAHRQSILNEGLQIVTPDESFNQALAWSRIALDQAWVCNAKLGCGFVAGYGPSRGMRRPQYAWFFGGDGLIATEAMLAEGDTERARQELAFILKYQNPKNGMIWHELSQSAGYIDWARYPYMYVHVDITYAFLSAVADYYEASGDQQFVQTYWGQLTAAWDACRALVDAQTGLPQIPADKEGGNEQQRMREDVSLSAAWAEAADAYQRLATAAGHPDQAAAARHALSARYWDPQKHFWIAGFSESGAPMTDERNHPGLLGQGFFTAEQENAALDRLASADFQTDWGTRGMSAQSPNFNPGSYATGSVSALATADTAEAFAREHRPAIAWAIWRSLLPWLRLDSLGHVHEVAAGDVFHQEVESVPEQTWSSAGVVSAAVHAVFGMEVDAPDHRLTLAPHLDPRWGEVTLRNIAVGPERVSVVLNQKPAEMEATFSADGPGLHVSFAPQIPLGAEGISAWLNGRRIPVHVEPHAEDEHARVEVDLPGGKAQCRITWTGGVRVLAPTPDPAVGDATRQLKLISVALSGKALSLQADVGDSDGASLRVQTPWKIGAVDGGSATAVGENWYRLTFTDVAAGAFRRRTMTVHLQPSQRARN